MSADATACAVDATERAEPLLATASRVRAWLAIEQPGAWGPDALIQSDLDPELGAAILARGRRAGVRVILIRRPRGSAPSSGSRCYLAHSGQRRSWLESIELDDPSALLDLDLSPLASDRPPSIGEPCARPLFLVCTNGRHDRCCADLGRPLVRALVGAGIEDVWECSHIGGDRFAANVVCLPEGVYLGRVGADEGPAVAADYAAGLLSLDHYRGRSCYPALVQAADLYIRQSVRIREADGLALIALDPLSDDRADVTFAATPASSKLVGRGWRARVSRRRSSAAIALTCRAEGLARPWEYHLDELVER
ncbi:MAG: sucrase ferredoxin [Acidimicrobiales bacterium]